MQLSRSRIQRFGSQTGLNWFLEFQNILSTFGQNFLRTWRNPENLQEKELPKTSQEPACRFGLSRVWPEFDVLLIYRDYSFSWFVGSIKTFHRLFWKRLGRSIRKFWMQDACKSSNLFREKDPNLFLIKLFNKKPNFQCSRLFEKRSSFSPWPVYSPIESLKFRIPRLSWER